MSLKKGFVIVDHCLINVRNVTGVRPRLHRPGCVVDLTGRYSYVFEKVSVTEMQAKLERVESENWIRPEYVEPPTLDFRRPCRRSTNMSNCTRGPHPSMVLDTSDTSDC